MFPSVGSAEIYVTWRKTIEKRSIFSRHVILAIIANLLNYLGMVELWQRYSGDLAVRPYLAPLFLVLVFLINYLGYYMVGAYKHVRSRLLAGNLDEKGSADLLYVSYLAFRLYFVGLLVWFVLMSVASLIPR